jgi:peptidoglycan/LPS O-acetylase OafA/YrhL
VPAQRLPLVDALKGVACALIVWHHLAFYGPMSDVVQPYAPLLVVWLYEYGRMAVAVFLVIGGFLSAGALAPRGEAVFSSPLPLLWRRYKRLALPYLVALIATMLVSAFVRPWFAHESVPAAPTLLQLLAHVALLQDLADYDALSAGVWYVAIDFQLFALTLGLLGIGRWLRTRWPGGGGRLGAALVLIAAVASLLWFNRDAALDATALYFMGAYGLGMLAYWSAHGSRPLRWRTAIALLGIFALALEFRERVLVACLTAVFLAWGARQAWAVRLPDWNWLVGLQWLGRVSYSVFLIHFAVCLLVNALVARWWPEAVLAHAVGLFAAFGLSVLAGWALYATVESRVGGARRVQPAAA